MFACHKTQSKCYGTTEEPFKATKLWNQIICDFSSGIALKRHRRHLRAYDNSFVACKAVDWLYEYLSTRKRNEKEKISRQQAVQLLDKFLTYDIIEKVVIKNTSCHKFKDNKDLYRLKNENIPQMENGRGAEEDVSYREEKMVMEKQWNNISSAMATTSTTSSGSESISPTIHGSQMKYEYDFNSAQVWKEVILRYLSMVQPLFTSFLDPREINAKFAAINSTHISKNGIVMVDDKTKDVPYWVMIAMKCLANWPHNSANSLPRYPGTGRDVFNLILEYFVGLDSSLIPSQFYPLIVSVVRYSDLQMIYRQRSSQIYAKVGLKNRDSLPISGNDSATRLTNRMNDVQRSNSLTNKLPNNDPIYETGLHFRGPPTRILSHDQLTSIFASMASSNISLDGSPLPQSSETFTWRRQSDNLQHLATLPRSSGKPKAEGLKRFKFDKEAFKSSSCLMNFGCILQSPCEVGEYMMDKSVTSLKNWHSAKIYSSEPLYGNFSKKHVNPSTANNSKLNSTEGDERVVSLLKLVLFLIPPENRRHLHLLLRLLTKIVKNPELTFLANNSTSMEYYIIETFTRCIIHSGNEKTYSEPTAQYLVSVMLKNTEEIFSLPAYVKYQVYNVLNC